MKKASGLKRRILAGVLALFLCLPVIPFLPETTQSVVEAAETHNVYVYGNAVFSYAYEVLTLVNEERAKYGLDPLTMDFDLMNAAMARAAENVVMYAATGSISHTRPNGDRCFTVCSKSYGENLAAGQKTPEEVVEAWMNSTEGHREAILTPGYKSIGIGCFEADDHYFHYYWAQEFGYNTAAQGKKMSDMGGFITVPVTDTNYSRLKGSSKCDGIIGFSTPGWKQDSRGWRYLMGNEYVKNSWMHDGGKWYFLDSNGYMVTGWKQIGGKWYYLSKSGAMKTGWLKLGKKWYFLNPGGAMVTGWKKVSGKWYYFTSDGAMKTGWVKSSGSWYYMDPSGAMITGSRKIGKKVYRFSSSGKCLNP